MIFGALKAFPIVSLFHNLLHFIFLGAVHKLAKSIGNLPARFLLSLIILHKQQHSLNSLAHARARGETEQDGTGKQRIIRFDYGSKLFCLHDLSQRTRCLMPQVRFWKRGGE